MFLTFRMTNNSEGTQGSVRDVTIVTTRRQSQSFSGEKNIQFFMTNVDRNPFNVQKQTYWNKMPF